MALAGNLQDRQHQALNRELNTGTPSQGVTLDSAIAGEDLTVGVMKVEQRFSYGTMVAAGTVTVKGSSGFLHTLVLGSTTAAAINIYDSASGTTTAMIASLKPSIAEQTFHFDVSMTNGIVVASAGTPNLTVSYR